MMFLESCSGRSVRQTGEGKHLSQEASEKAISLGTLHTSFVDSFHK